MRNIFMLSSLFISFITLSSCEKDAAYAVQCVGDNCMQTNDYPACLDDNHLIISDDPGMSPMYCPNGCLNGKCIPDSPECTSGMAQCLTDMKLQICINEVWVISECHEKCENGTCISQPLCSNGERRCSDSNVEECHNGLWTVKETCPFGCHLGSCSEGCSGSDSCLDSTTLKQCINGSWETTPCPNGCKDGKCQEGCNAPNSCLNSDTLQKCVDNKWTTVVCKNGCRNDKCIPDAEDSYDPRLTNRICTKDDFFEDNYVDICSPRNETSPGSVCIASDDDALFCLDVCDPNNLPNYHCSPGHEPNVNAFAATADCLQLSDGTYVLFNTGTAACANVCTPQDGCDEIVKYYENPGLISCSPSNYYCEGTIAHTCYGGPTECNDNGKVCVQFGIPTYCATPCETEGDIRYECLPGDGGTYSNKANCIRDDHGTLTWQYVQPTHCTNGCNQKTGLCK